MNKSELLHNSLPVGYLLQEYRIEELLEANECCMTYLAVDTNLSINVVIREYFPVNLACREKDFSLSVLDPDFADHYARCLRTYLEQIKNITTLRLPNIEKVVRYFSANRTGYMVTEYEAGQTLRNFLINDKAALDEIALIELLRPIFENLEKLHTANLFHGAIKPSSIYLRETAGPLLLDFCGACFDLFLPSNYSAPEDFSEPYTPAAASDIYACGAVMYQCATGQIPLSADQRMMAVEYGDKDPLPAATSLQSHSYSIQILSLIDQMISLEKEKRPDSAGVVLEHLARLSSMQSATATVTIEKNKSSLITNNEHRKIIITGTAGSGKSMAINRLSDELLLSDVNKTIQTHHELKQVMSRTIDHGIMKISGDNKLHLFGIPAQRRFVSHWENLQIGAIGIILLIDNSRKDPLRDLESFMHNFFDNTCPAIVIGVTHTDASRTPAISDYHAYIQSRACLFKSKPAVFSVYPGNHQQMLMLVEALLYTADPLITDSFQKNDYTSI